MTLRDYDASTITSFLFGGIGTAQVFAYTLFSSVSLRPSILLLVIVAEMAVLSLSAGLYYKRKIAYAIAQISLLPQVVVFLSVAPKAGYIVFVCIAVLYISTEYSRRRLFDEKLQQRIGV